MENYHYVDIISISIQSMAPYWHRQAVNWSSILTMGQQFGTICHLLSVTVVCHWRRLGGGWELIVCRMQNSVLL